MTVRDRMHQNPRRKISMQALLHAVKDWDFFRICTPDITFSSQLDLDLGNLTLQLHHMPESRHADDSVVAKVPEAGVMFLGDCYYPPPFHLREDGDEDLHLPMLEQLAADHCELYIDGHGAPRTLFEFQRMIDTERQRQQT
jgi:glyoxylase-like metal-dependent hydrolase (beta-lactamase superfamily II)